MIINSESRDSKDIRILVVEDSPTQIDRLRFTLERHGYELIAARNGKEALEAMREPPLPSLIISDVVMPEISGYQLCSFVKKDPDLRHIPVILLTSLTDPVDVMRGLECGADNFIFKPYDDEYLFARIAFVLANSHLRESDIAQMGLEISFCGQKFVITSDRMQIFNLLLSTYEAAVEKNRSLVSVTAELESKNRLFESEIAERKRAEEELIKAKDEAERASAAKADFLSNMSHELRTPLNAVIGYSDLLQRRSDNPTTIEYSESIFKAGHHLLDLVNELLDLARIEAGKLTISLEPVNLGNTITQAVELVKPIADEKGVTIRVFDDVCADLYVMADRQRLVQVLMNLIANAAKYNKPDGQIVIQCVSDGEGVRRIEISDTGPGIGNDAQVRLFKPFERGNNEAEPGTGLGLALSRRLMELMSGKLLLASTSSEGSTFAVEVQATEVPKEAVDAARMQNVVKPLGADGFRVVYIEDNVSNLQVMERILEDVVGLQLLPALTAKEGVQVVRDNVPDLVLLDLHLPDASGLDVLHELRSDPKTAKIPVIVLSADATGKQTKLLLEAGAKSYLTKPIDMSVLFAELNEVIASRRGATNASN